MSVDAAAERLDLGVTESLGRPTVARLMIESGYVTSVEDAFSRWLGRGRPAYVPREGIGPVRAINAIRAAGGPAGPRPFRRGRGPRIDDPRPPGHRPGRARGLLPDVRRRRTSTRSAGSPTSSASSRPAAATSTATPAAYAEIHATTWVPRGRSASGSLNALRAARRRPVVASWRLTRDELSQPGAGAGAADARGAGAAARASAGRRSSPTDERVGEFRPEAPALPRFAIWTLGCQMNRSDSEEMAGRLLGAGCDEAAGFEDGRPDRDQHLCDPRGRRAEGDRPPGPAGASSRRRSPGLRVVLTGCSVREPDRAGLRRRYPAVDLFLRPDEEPELVDRLGLASAQGADRPGAGRRRPA